MISIHNTIMIWRQVTNNLVVKCYSVLYILSPLLDLGASCLKSTEGLRIR